MVHICGPPKQLIIGAKRQHLFFGSFSKQSEWFATWHIQLHVLLQKCSLSQVILIIVTISLPEKFRRSIKISYENQRYPYDFVMSECI
jgi:hypothetical protein